MHSNNLSPIHLHNGRGSITNDAKLSLRTCGPRTNVSCHSPFSLPPVLPGHCLKINHHSPPPNHRTAEVRLTFPAPRGLHSSPKLPSPPCSSPMRPMVHRTDTRPRRRTQINAQRSPLPRHPPRCSSSPRSLVPEQLWLVPLLLCTPRCCTALALNPNHSSPGAVPSAEPGTGRAIREAE
jgi:hypothetical protein